MTEKDLAENEPGTRTESRLELTDDGEAIRVFGVHDRNLKLVREHFGVEVTARECRLTVRGPEREVDRAIELLERMAECARRQGNPDKLIDEAQEEIRDLSDDVQDRAEGLMDRVRGRANIGKLQSAFDKRVADTMDRMNVPSKNDIDKINKKLNKILRAIESQGKPAPTKRKTASKKTVSKKAPAKPAGSKAA